MIIDFLVIYICTLTMDWMMYTKICFSFNVDRRFERLKFVLTNKSGTGRHKKWCSINFLLVFHSWFLCISCQEMRSGWWTKTKYNINKCKLLTLSLFSVSRACINALRLSLCSSNFWAVSFSFFHSSEIISSFLFSWSSNLFTIPCRVSSNDLKLCALPAMQTQ